MQNRPQLTVYDSQKRQLFKEDHKAEIKLLSLSPDCQHVLQYEKLDGNNLVEEEFLGIKTSVMWSPNQKYVAARVEGLNKIYILLYEMLNQRLQKIGQHPVSSRYVNAKMSIDFSSDSQYLSYITNDHTGDSPRLIVLDVPSLSKSMSFRLISERRYHVQTWNPKCNMIALVTGSNFNNSGISTLHIGNLGNDIGHQQKWILDTLNVGPIHWSPDGQYLAFLTPVRRRFEWARIHESGSISGEPVDKSISGYKILDITFDQTQDHVLVVSVPSSALFFNLQTEQCILQVFHQGVIKQIASNGLVCERQGYVWSLFAIKAWHGLQWMGPKEYAQQLQELPKEQIEETIDLLLKYGAKDSTTGDLCNGYKFLFWELSKNMKETYIRWDQADFLATLSQKSEQ